MGVCTPNKDKLTLARFQAKGSWPGRAADNVTIRGRMCLPMIGHESVE